ncbi:2,3-dihydro-3-hydroxyanthranilate isomerase [Vibrio sp. vnigr-6D03]|uniref:PhzF family phenazine biosynthesis protein n=1 Tax=Vibrio sp. vnigr-6D03 TaxID=2058088 RepID=UPI000C3255C3|nr:PhzF family phenazine biosynthesis isomerase [Vibrio sp. vnigr-6D03]PKF80049.1 2,3-dihydro-3-hydroxyanthranilate isomerase [Vibrio sp. vnigr-6D03]
MHSYVVADSFCERPLSGNPVAIFFDSDDIPTEKMQLMASQMNLSESTFVCRTNGNADVNIRVFTPVNELPFAGHPLLGTALAISIRDGKNSIVFETKKGNFRFNISDQKHEGETQSAFINMEMPEPVISSYHSYEHLLEAAGLDRSTLPIELYDVGPRHVFVGVKDEKTLANIKPDINKLAKHKDMALLCFCESDGYWRLRMFSPAYGVVEDAATGSAAAPFALHLARHGKINFGDQIKIIQGIEMGRESIMYGTAFDGSNSFTLQVAGHAIISAQGVYFS